jgi:hypothetical protein
MPIDSLQDSVLRRGIHPRDWEAEVARRLEAIDRWCEKWSLCAGKPSLRLRGLLIIVGKHNDGGSATFSMQSSVMVNYHQAKLAVNTVFLQGVRTAQDVTPLQLKHIYQAGKYPQSLSFNHHVLECLLSLLPSTSLSSGNADHISCFGTRSV